MSICKYCGKECKNANSLRNHERLCKKNPDRQIHPPKTDKWKDAVKGKIGSNQYIKAKELGLPPPMISEETRNKLSISTTNLNKIKYSDPIERKLQSDRMLIAVMENPDSYTSSNRGRTKQIEKYGVKFQGNWELLYWEYCLNNSIAIQRCTERFPYEWNGCRTYNPDFYLSETDTYIEIKGYETDRDRAKWRDFPKTLKVIKYKELKELVPL